MALGLATLTANADYSEYFTVSYEGKEVKNGETVTINKPTKEENGFKAYFPHFDVTFFNLSPDEEEEQFVGGSLWYDTPSKDECIGAVSLCSSANCYPSTSDPSNIGYLDALGLLLGDDPFNWQPHLENIPADKKFTQTYRLTMCMKEQEIINTQGDVVYNPIEGSEFTMYIKFTSETNAIEGIDAENAEAEYFTLQGVRVAEPENGLYIVKRGEKVTKEIVRK